MDDRDQPDTNVVPLQRRRETGDGQRAHVASKIFAAQDEISTFSVGNLIEPATRNEPPADANGIAADGTDEFFERLIADTPAQPPGDASGGMPAPAMPGSAGLPAEVPVRRRRGVRALAPRLPLRWSLRASALAGATVALIAGAAVAAVVLPRGRGSPRMHQAAQLAGAKASGQEQADAASMWKARVLAIYHDALAARRAHSEPWHPVRGRSNTHQARASGRKVVVVVVRYSPPVNPPTITQASAGDTAYQPATYSRPATTASSATNPELAATTASQVASSPPPVTQRPGPTGPGYVIGSNCDPKCR
jgi:hypothetical protein